MLFRSQAVGATAAINASYFDKSGWIIGNLKYGNIWLGMETLPRSAIVMKNKKAQVIKDLAYAGNISFPTLNNLTLAIKGVNRERIADDIVLYNRHFDDGTRTNCYGLEMRISNGIITEISRAGNMKLDDKSLVLSVHGVHLNSLASLKVGDRINLRKGFNQNIADDADLVIGGGPLLVENGRKNVRINQEKIPNDIARGRAPRTALGIKKDGTMIFLVVDGRRSDSVGMTLDELADYLIKIGAEQAINLDGGGSSVMVLNNKIVNKPSDGKERFISVGMGIFRA